MEHRVTERNSRQEGVRKEDQSNSRKFLRIVENEVSSLKGPSKMNKNRPTLTHSTMKFQNTLKIIQLPDRTLKESGIKMALDLSIATLKARI